MERLAERTTHLTTLAALFALVACGTDGGTDGGGGGTTVASTGATDAASSATTATSAATSAAAQSSADTSTSSGGACLASTEPCDDDTMCCEGLSCDTTTLGKVCCGNVSAPCATANGEDCCGNLLCVAGTCLAPGQMPLFQAPLPCGETWTYSHHAQEVRRALDFVSDGGTTNGAPVLAAAAGIATQHHEPGGAGDYIAIEHGGGWRTYYFHLQAFSVADGTMVTQGQEIGLVGSTGASSGPHLHFEELLNGQGQDIWLDGVALAPYPGSYGQKSVVSANCPED